MNILNHEANRGLIVISLILVILLIGAGFAISSKQNQIDSLKQQNENLTAQNTELDWNYTTKQEIMNVCASNLDNLDQKTCSVSFIFFNYTRAMDQIKTVKNFCRQYPDSSYCQSIEQELKE